MDTHHEPPEASDERARGIYGKYHVERADGTSGPGGKHENCFVFVLDVDHDRCAVPALRAYAEAVHLDGYYQLATDLSEAADAAEARWLRHDEEANPAGA